jgi:hypothetical protein
VIPEAVDVEFFNPKNARVVRLPEPNYGDHGLTSPASRRLLSLMDADWADGIEPEPPLPAVPPPAKRSRSKPASRKARGGSFTDDLVVELDVPPVVKPGGKQPGAKDELPRKSPQPPAPAAARVYKDDEDDGFEERDGSDWAQMQSKIVEAVAGDTAKVLRGQSVRSRPGAPAPKEVARDPSEFRFLSVFKWEERKGWSFLLDAFLNEFTVADRTALYILSRPYMGVSDHFIRDQVRRHARAPLRRSEARPRCQLAQRISNVSAASKLPLKSLPPIMLLNPEIPTTVMPNLFRSVDAFVLPSRGEGAATRARALSA